MKEKDLLELKEEIELAQQRLSELKGEERYLLKELKDKWGCGSLEEALKKVEQMEEEVRKLDQEIQTAIDEIRREYNV